MWNHERILYFKFEEFTSYLYILENNLFKVEIILAFCYALHGKNKTKTYPDG